MWILIVLFLFIPLVPFQILLDRDMEKYPDYSMEKSGVEIAQFVSYSNAIRKMASNNPNSSDAFSEEDLAKYKVNPLLKFPDFAHGNCATQPISVPIHNIDGTDTHESIRFRVAWIEPKSKEWKENTGSLDMHFFGIYEDGTMKTLGIWKDITLCKTPTQESLFFVIKQK